MKMLAENSTRDEVLMQMPWMQDHERMTTIKTKIQLEVREFLLKSVPGKTGNCVHMQTLIRTE